MAGFKVAQGKLSVCGHARPLKRYNRHNRNTQPERGVSRQNPENQFDVTSDGRSKVAGREAGNIDSAIGPSSHHDTIGEDSETLKVIARRSQNGESLKAVDSACAQVGIV